MTRLPETKIGYYLRDQDPDQYLSTSQSKSERRKRKKGHESHPPLDNSSSPPRHDKKVIRSGPAMKIAQQQEYPNPRSDIQALADSLIRNDKVPPSDMSQYTEMKRQQQLQQHGIQVLTRFAPQFESSQQQMPLPPSFPFGTSLQGHGSPPLLPGTLADAAQQITESRLG